MAAETFDRHVMFISLRAWFYSVPENLKLFLKNVLEILRYYVPLSNLAPNFFAFFFFCFMVEQNFSKAFLFLC